jgi:hypothetical protein
MLRNNFQLFALLALLLTLTYSCSKPASNLEVPPSLAKFIGDEDQSYSIVSDPAPAYTVQVGLTTVADQDRTVTVKVTSSTGATEGTHYSLGGLGSGGTISIPAGEVLGSFTVTGVYDQYISGRKDTLIIALTTPGVEVANFNDTIRLLMRGPCFDGDVTEAELAALVGVYNNSIDAGFGDYGPYPTRVVSITPLTATTARAVINNVWDYGFGDVPFIMDWSDPANTVINVEAPTITPADAGILNSAYDGMNLVIRAAPAASTAANNFSICNSRINLRYQLGVYDPGSGAILGYFGTVATTVMRR